MRLIFALYIFVYIVHCDRNILFYSTPNADYSIGFGEINSNGQLVTSNITEPLLDSLQDPPLMIALKNPPRLLIYGSHLNLMDDTELNGFVLYDIKENHFSANPSSSNFPYLSGGLLVKEWDQDRLIILGGNVKAPSGIDYNGSALCSVVNGSCETFSILAGIANDPMLFRVYDLVQTPEAIFVLLAQDVQVNHYELRHYDKFTGEMIQQLLSFGESGCAFASSPYVSYANGLVIFGGFRDPMTTRTCGGVPISNIAVWNGSCWYSNAINGLNAHCVSGVIRATDRYLGFSNDRRINEASNGADWTGGQGSNLNFPLIPVYGNSSYLIVGLGSPSSNYSLALLNYFSNEVTELSGTGCKHFTSPVEINGMIWSLCTNTVSFTLIQTNMSQAVSPQSLHTSSLTVPHYFFSYNLNKLDCLAAAKGMVIATGSFYTGAQKRNVMLWNGYTWIPKELSGIDETKTSRLACYSDSNILYIMYLTSQNIRLWRIDTNTGNESIDNILNLLQHPIQGVNDLAIKGDTIVITGQDKTLIIPTLSTGVNIPSNRVVLFQDKIFVTSTNQFQLIQLSTSNPSNEEQFYDAPSSLIDISGYSDDSNYLLFASTDTDILKFDGTNFLTVYTTEDTPSRILYEVLSNQVYTITARGGILKGNENEKITIVEPNLLENELNHSFMTFWGEEPFVIVPARTAKATDTNTDGPMGTDTDLITGTGTGPSTSGLDTTHVATTGEAETTTSSTTSSSTTASSTTGFVDSTTLESTTSLSPVWTTSEVITTSALNPTTEFNDNLSGNSSDNELAAITVILIVIGFIVLFALLGFFLIYRRRRRYTDQQKNELDHSNNDISTSQVASIMSSVRNSIEMRDSIYETATADTLTNITVLERLGGGAFGEVFRGVWNTHVPVALKKLKSQNDVDEFIKEASILKALSFPHVIQYFGIYKSPTSERYIVTEFLPKGNLSHYLSTIGKKIVTFNDLVGMARDAAAGLEYLHSKGIVHGDLALRNFLLSDTGGIDRARYLVKVGDFGMSKLLQSKEYYKSDSKVIPFKWASPETIEYGTFSFASDVWSFGIVLWELFSYGKLPYPLLSNIEVLSQLKTGYRMECPDNCPEDIYIWMVQSWKWDPEARPIMERISSFFYSKWSILNPRIHEPATNNSSSSSTNNSGSSDHIYHTRAISKKSNSNNNNNTSGSSDSSHIKTDPNFYA